MPKINCRLVGFFNVVVSAPTIAEIWSAFSTLEIARGWVFCPPRSSNCRNFPPSVEAGTLKSEEDHFKYFFCSKSKPIFKPVVEEK
jgi:hypothetical protein